MAAGPHRRKTAAASGGTPNSWRSWPTDPRRPRRTPRMARAVLPHPTRPGPLRPRRDQPTTRPRCDQVEAAIAGISQPLSSGCPTGGGVRRCAIASSARSSSPRSRTRPTNTSLARATMPAPQASAAVRGPEVSTSQALGGLGARLSRPANAGTPVPDQGLSGLVATPQGHLQRSSKRPNLYSDEEILATQQFLVRC